MATCNFNEIYNLPGLSLNPPLFQYIHHDNKYSVRACTYK